MRFQIQKSSFFEAKYECILQIRGSSVYLRRSETQPGIKGYEVFEWEWLDGCSYLLHCPFSLVPARCVWRILEKDGPELSRGQFDIPTFVESIVTCRQRSYTRWEVHSATPETWLCKNWKCCGGGLLRTISGRIIAAWRYDRWGNVTGAWRNKMDNQKMAVIFGMVALKSFIDVHNGWA